MSTVIHCPCGHIVRAPDRDRLIEAAQRHAKEVHGAELTRDQALAMSRPE